MIVIEPWRGRAVLPKARGFLDDLGRRISEEHLIHFDARAIGFLALLLILFIPAVGLKLNGSSCAVWDQIIKDNETEPQSNVIFGNPRGIRSDEWAVATPFILSQAAKGFPVQNETLGAGKTPLVSTYSLPVAHFTTLFKPQHWGYFLFDVERGFSFYWNYRIFGLAIGLFLLLMLVTGNSFLLSVTGASWIFFSGYTQWWFSTVIPEIVIAFCAVTVSLIHALTSGSRTAMVLGWLVFAIYSINFTLCFYPPSQIVIAYLGLAVVAGYLAEKGRWGLMRANLPARAAFGAVSFGVIAAVLFAFYSEARESIDLIVGTAYPGNRISFGGEMDLVKYFSSYYDIIRGRGSFNSRLGNVCEASNFLNLLPFALVLFAGTARDSRKVDRLSISLLTYVVLMSLWVFVGGHGFLVKISLIDRVSTNRALLGIGIAAIFLTLRWVRFSVASGTGKDTLKDTFRGWRSVFPVFMILLAFCLHTNIHYGDFPKLSHIALVCFVFTLIVTSMLCGKKLLFCALIVLVTMAPGAPVNPVCTGLGPFFNKDVNAVVQEIAAKDPDAGWVIFGMDQTQKFFVATGVKVLNAVKYIPDFKTLKVLDPDGKYTYTYNRYAHIMFEPGEGDSVEFKLLTADSYLVKIDPCSARLKSLGVRYVVLPDKPGYFDMAAGKRSGLHPVVDHPVNRLWVCRLE